jgi:hypothetical protein
LYWPLAIPTPFTFALFPSLKITELTDCNYAPSTGFCPDVVQPVAGLEVQLPNGSAATLWPVPCDLCGLLLGPSKLSLLGTWSSQGFYQSS